MSLTSQQARRILLELYAESHDSSDTMFGVLNATRLAAIWKACQVLKERIEAEGAGVLQPDAAAVESEPQPPQGKTGKAE